MDPKKSGFGPVLLTIGIVLALPWIARLLVAYVEWVWK